MIRFSILFVLIFSTFLSASETTVSASNELKVILGSLTNFSASFNQQVVDQEGNVVHEAEGNIQIAKPNKLRWHTQLPDEILLIADGQSVWQVDYFVEQVTIINQQSAMENNPLMLLTSATQDDWDKFSITKDVNSFVITSKESAQIQSLILTFNDGVLHSLQSRDAQGQDSTITFSNIRQNTDEDTSSWFTLTIPESFYIDDQRQPTF